VPESATEKAELRAGFQMGFEEAARRKHFLATSVRR